MMNVGNTIQIALQMERHVLIENCVVMLVFKRLVIQIFKEMNANGTSDFLIVLQNHVLLRLNITLQKEIVKNIFLKVIVLQD